MYYDNYFDAQQFGETPIQPEQEAPVNYFTPEMMQYMQQYQQQFAQQFPQQMNQLPQMQDCPQNYQQGFEGFYAQ